MRFARSTLLSLLSAAFIAGILARYFGFQFAVWSLFAIILTILFWLIDRRLIWTIALLAAITIGFWRANAHTSYINHFRQYYGQKVTTSGTIADDPAVSDKGYLQFNLSLNSFNSKPASGMLAVRTYNQKLRRGYHITATSKFDAPLGNKVGELVFATIEVNDSRLGPIETWRQRFFAGMRTALPEPYAGFALGLLLGTRAVISTDVQTMLTAIGLTHLIAVSGYNLTILINATRQPLANLSRFIALAVPLGLIFLFMLLTGFSASIVRAAIVSSLTLIAAYYGRRYKPLVLLALTAVITLAVNPAYLWSDVGWQLSFLAFAGILIVAPLLQQRWRIKNAWAKLGVESLAAYIMTLPLIMAVFGRVSIVAPLANVIILPLVPLTMLLSFIVGILGMATPLAFTISLPLRLLLAGQFAIMHSLASMPHASTMATISPAYSISVYVLIIIVIALLHFDQRRRSFVLR